MRTPTNFSEAISKFFTYNTDARIAFKRGLDEFFFKQRWHDYRMRQRVYIQKFSYEAHQQLGSDLAVAKFAIRQLGGRIQDHRGVWINRTKDLPPDYDKSFKVTAVDVARGDLVVEGVDNFIGIEHCEFLDLSGNPRLNEFACDQLARQFRGSRKLHEIDLSYNPAITVYALEILLRIPSIRRIVAYDTMASKFEDIDLFVLAAEEEKKCDIFVHKDGRKYKNDELEELRTDSLKKLNASET